MTSWFTNSGVEFTGAVHSTNEAKGTAKYEVPYPCSRCGGAGGAERWAFTGFTCFECGGHGFKGRTRAVTVYTQERYAKLEAARTRRALAKGAKQIAEAEARAERQRQAFHERTAAFDAAYPNFAARLRSYAEGNEFLNDLHTKLTEVVGFLTDAQVSAAEIAIERIEHARASRHISGEVGDRITLTLTVEKVIIPDSVGYYTIPPSWTYICRDSDGNAVIYRGRSDAMPIKGETASMVATIKAFDVYRETKQTVIARPKRARE